MLTVHNLTKSYDLSPLFSGVTFSINSGDRVGLIGPNGSGKTTLMRLIANSINQTHAEPFGGHVTANPNLRVGYLPQGFELDGSATVGDIIGRAVGNASSLEDELMQVADSLAQNPNDPALQARYDDILQQMAQPEANQLSSIIPALGLDGIPSSQKASTLSGGQKTRLSLALILLNDPQLLLLDEPTNHLDIAMLEWLETWLAGFRGGCLLISHDRTFLDRTANRILELDPHTKTTRSYVGGYSDYVAQHQSERAKQWAAYKDQVYEVRRMKQDIARTREQSDKVHRNTKPNQPNVRRLAKKVMKKAKSREKKLERYVDSAERVEKPSRSWQLKLDFDNQVPLGRDVLKLDKLTVGYLPQGLLHELDLTLQAGQRVVLTGENGSGKTTLIKTIAGKLAPLAGSATLGGSVKLGYMSQEQELLDPKTTPLQVIMQAPFESETDARSFLHFFLFTGDEALKPNELLSYGQRARLQLALLIAQGCNFLLLDEPINHLDIPSREMFEQALLNFKGTILAVIHDRYFISRFATDVWWVENGEIRQELK